jgi:D-3-phosphoglycerate dehydrogenase
MTNEPYNILIATELTDESLQLLRSTGNASFQIIDAQPAMLHEKLADAHALIARDDVEINAELLDHAPRLKVIARLSVNVSGIDIETATQRGIMVMNAPGASSIAAGEHTFALMLALSRHLVAAHDSLLSGDWQAHRKQQMGTQLRGKYLGIIGLGRVGSVVAQRALAFGMQVLAYDPYLREDQVSDERITLSGLRELLEKSDFVSLHIPATTETRGLLNADRIQQMKPGARLINTAHGSLMDEQAVAQALLDGHLAGVAVDVYAEEPPDHSPLIGLENVIHTPHIGDNTIEATQDLSLQIVRQTLDALNDVEYRNVVNMPLMPGIDFEAIRPYLSLAERMGAILDLLSRSPLRKVAVEFRGDDVSGLVKPLTVALLKGLLAPVLGETVSYVNAPLLAHDRGIQVAQVKGLKTGNYTNLVSCQITLEDGEEILMGGTLLDQKEPHIVQVNEYRMNFVPTGHLLIMGSFDQPGVIGRVGTFMADNNVNIAGWFTGRAQPGGQTLSVLTLDEPIAESALDELRQMDFIRHAHQAEL